MATQLTLWVEEVVEMPDWLVGSEDPMAKAFLADSVDAERGSFVDESELVWDEDDYLDDIAQRSVTIISPEHDLKLLTAYLLRQEFVMCAKSRFVFFPCKDHLPHGRTFRMGDALGDLFWEDQDGSRKHLASCRECAEGMPPYVEDMSVPHFPLHLLPESN